VGKHNSDGPLPSLEVMQSSLFDLDSPRIQASPQIWSILTGPVVIGVAGYSVLLASRDRFEHRQHILACAVVSAESMDLGHHVVFFFQKLGSAG